MRTALPILFLLLTLAPQFAAAAPDDAPVGKARLTLPGSIETLDPPKASSEAARCCVANLYDQLYEYAHLSRPFELKPCLAAALPEVSEDGRTFVIRLRKGVRYVDDPCMPGGKGRELKAADVVFCILRLMDAHVASPGSWMFAGKVVGLDAFAEASAKASSDPNRSAYAESEGYPHVPGLVALDDSALRIHLTEPLPELPWLLASPWLSVYPPEAVKAYGAGLARRAVGTGPFKITLFLPPQKLLLQSNPGYREERYPSEASGRDRRLGLLVDAGKRLPLSERIDVVAYADPLAAWSAFQSGEVDCAEVPRDSFTAVVDVQTGRLLPLFEKRAVRLHRDPRQEIFYDAFNWLDPVLGKPAGEQGAAIRQAICLAANDRHAMTETYRYHAERVHGPILPEMRGYERGFTNDYLPMDDETREQSLAAARDILAVAGLPGGKGVPVLRMHILNDANSNTEFKIRQRQLAEIGIQVECLPVSWPEMQRVLETRKAQMWTSSWYADYPDAQNFLQLFYGPNAPNPNFSNYDNQEFNELYEDARLLPPGPERDHLYREMQKTVTQDCPWRYRFRRIRWSANQAWLYGYRHNDIVQKYFKYVRADEQARAEAIKGWN